LAAAVSHQAASAGVPPAVVSATIRAATILVAGSAPAGVISAQVAALADGVLKGMLVAKLRFAAALLLLTVVGTAGAWGLRWHAQADPQAEMANEQPGRAEAAFERLGDTRLKEEGERGRPHNPAKEAARPGVVEYAAVDGFDAVVDDATRGFARQKKTPGSFYYGKLTRDSRGRVVSTIYKEGLVTRDTRVVRGTLGEKKKWVLGQAIEGGVEADLFREAGRVVQVRVALGEDQKTIRQIVVTKADEPLVLADSEFDAILRQVGPQTNGQGTIWYMRLELDEKGVVVKTFALKSGQVTRDTRVVVGRYKQEEEKWEAGEAVPRGLYGDIFKDLDAKRVHVRLTLRDDRKAISQILVCQVGQAGGKQSGGSGVRKGSALR
jgi:hypothetical protein